MKIALICRNLHTAGGRVVALNFVGHLRRVPFSHRYLIVAPPGVGYEDLDLPDSSETFVYRGGQAPLNQWRFDTAELPKAVRKFGADVVFAMGNIGLVSPPCPQAILFHKPHLVYPVKHYPTETLRARLKNRLLKMRLKDCLRNTDLVFCQTEVARARFSRNLSYPMDRIKLMPNAVSEFVSIPHQHSGVPAIFSDKRFFNLFFLTKFYAHKNLESLLSLYGKHRSLLSDVRCIITVSPEQHPNAPKFLAEIARRGLQKHIVNVGPLKQEELAGYFYNADALFFPTLMESFSGTYLEAMHFGLPILTSNLDFAEYVCGDAALYFDPWDTDDMLNKIQRLRQDPELKEVLVSKGRERMKRFFKSWDQITAETVLELEKLAGVRR